MQDIFVVKESGEREKYRQQKVRHALKRIGLSENETAEVLHELEKRLYEGMTTKKIYAILYEIIENRKPELSHRYNLKRALFEIGPDGYSFETFISRLLELNGYETKLRQIVKGKCINHEIDVVATKNDKTYMIECKFHNQPGTRCRVQTILYVHSRYLDLREGTKKGYCCKFDKPWLITNTKFSEDVRSYAECMELPLLGWRYPAKNSLEVMVDKSKCYPITVINMNNDTLRKLLSKDIVTVYDIPENANKLANITSVPISIAKQIVEKAAYARD
ncbi:MAG: restriction endonuclease [Candidatus Micrarchaeota archaeon]